MHCFQIWIPTILSSLFTLINSGCDSSNVHIALTRNTILLNMTLPQTEEDEIQQEADNIAASITRILVSAFKAKENRDPTNEEIDMLIEELTEDRIAEMLGETFATSDENIVDDVDVDKEVNDNDADDGSENVKAENEKEGQESSASIVSETQDKESDVSVAEPESECKKRKLEEVVEDVANDATKTSDV